jgi:hypothetical protein
MMPSNDASGLDNTGITIRPRQPDPLIVHNVAPGRLQFVNQQNTNLISSYNQVNYMPGDNGTNGDTGITLRQPRDGDYHRQSVQASGLVNHGIARRRLCLQTRLDIGTMFCPPNGSVKPDEIEVGHLFVIITLFGIYISLLLLLFLLLELVFTLMVLCGDSSLVNKWMRALVILVPNFLLVLQMPPV